MSRSQSRPTLTYLINALEYGGAEIGMLRLLSGLETEEFDVTVVTLRGAEPALERDLPDHVTLEQLALDEGVGVGKLRTLVRTIRAADLLVGSLYPSVVVGAVGGTALRVPTIFSWKHNTTAGGRLSRLVNKLTFRLSDRVLVDSDATRRLISEWGIGDQRIVKLPISGIDVDDHPPADHIATGSDVRIGTVGSLTLQKGYPELLACARRLPEYEFHVVGDGPLADEIAQGPDNVVLHGTVSQDELQELWQSFDIYFQPSRWEGLCITAIEGMASRLPVVASAVDGLTESVVDGETGYLVDQGDIEGYCSRLTELATDPDRRSQFGTAGRDRVQAEYSAEAFAATFREVVADATA
ncbi:glycosyltransferase family 4 protein [Natronococcus roseus]|uniref:glycosyltransferase family 4 protein n=1 Tax=Natronococcus roseus TaxID=1052014 RepID=UPI00374DEFCD